MRSVSSLLNRPKPRVGVWRAAVPADDRVDHDVVAGVSDTTSELDRSDALSDRPFHIEWRDREALDVEGTCRFESLEDRPVEAERARPQHPATGWNGRLDHAEVSPVSVGARRVTWGLPSRQVYSCVRRATRHMLSTSCTRWSR